MDEQIRLAEQELNDFEKHCGAEISFRRGNLNALKCVKECKAVISVAPPKP